MAENYLCELRELQPEGPYYLGGFCMGGQVAFEMAQRLVRDGERVNLLFLIDTHNFNGAPAPLPQTEKTGPQARKSRTARAAEKTKVALRREIERWRIRMVHLFHLNPDRDVLGPQERVLERINDRAFLAYAPAVYPGKVTICKPQRKYAFLRDPFNGWREIAAGGLEMIALTVETKDIFTKPFVQTLAARLQETLELAFSGRTKAAKNGDLQIKWRVVHEPLNANSEKAGPKTRLYETNA